MVLSGTVTYTNPLTYYPIPYTYTTHNTITTNGGWNGNTTYTTNNTLGGNTSFTTTSTDMFNTNRAIYTSGIANNVFYNSSLTSGDSNIKTLVSKEPPINPLRQVETGRVEMGSNSDQSFTYDNTQFYSYASTVDTWNIKPASTKPVVREELVTYCTECGAKKKKDTHKFCPNCGTKF